MFLEKNQNFQSVRDLIVTTFSTLDKHVQHPSNCEELLSLISFAKYNIVVEYFERDDAMYEEQKEQER